MANRGALDRERFRNLQDGARAIRRILPRLHGEDAAYIRRLIQISELINDDRRPAS